MMDVVMKVKFPVKEKTQASPDRLGMKYGAPDRSEIDRGVGRIVGSSEVKHF